MLIRPRFAVWLVIAFAPFVAWLEFLMAVFEIWKQIIDLGASAACLCKDRNIGQMAEQYEGNKFHKSN